MFGYLAAIVLMHLVSPVQADPTTRVSRLAVAKSLWEDRLTKAGGKPIVSEYYPTEEALVFLTAYDLTRDDRYAKQAAVQLDYCHCREKDGIFLTSKNRMTRDYQARHIYNFYLAYRILGDGRYLRWADDGARAMLKRLPREPHTIANETHTLFLAGFFDVNGKPVESTGNVIDVNQNAEVALAYTLLYHDPASSFFLDPTAKDIAYEELLASMSIQDMTTGAIPLTEGIPGADTAYGSYAVFSWTWSQLFWHEEKFEPHLQAAARWLAPKMNLKKDSDRYYPTRIENGIVPYWEAYFRLPLLWYAKVDAQQFIADLAQRIQDPTAVPNDHATAPASWAYYDLMGIPRAYFIDGNPAAVPRTRQE
jgi:hypothetical protein